MVTQTTWERVAQEPVSKCWSLLSFTLLWRPASEGEKALLERGRGVKCRAPVLIFLQNPEA